jgi:Rrf2 family transcriptional regulator, iron-sulfur cluster assembly transcription factor
MLPGAGGSSKGAMAPRSLTSALGVPHVRRAMRLSQKAQYAICGMFDLAYNGQGDPIQVRVIGARQRIPQRYLEQIFQRLRRADLIRGKRGPGGGYVLARSPSSITLREIVEAVDGPIAPRLAEGPAPRDTPVPHRPDFLWAELGAAVESALDAIHLESLCRRAAGRAVHRADAESRMWHI